MQRDSFATVIRSTVLAILFATATTCASGLIAAEVQPLPPSHEVKPQLYATGFVFAEGPALTKDGTLYVVNYRGLGNIGKIAADGTAEVFCDLNEIAPVEGRKAQANGLKIDAAGRIIAADAGAARLLRISPDGKTVEVLADRFDGARFRAINDVCLDRSGNIYFSDPGGSSKDNPIGCVYKYDINTKRVSRLATGLAFPNGVGVTPDQTHLIIAESQKYRLLKLKLPTSSADISEPTTLIDFPTETKDEIRGGEFDPDGLILDEAGRIYVGMWIGGVINVVDSETGELLRQYDAGGTKATNCHFHDGKLYTTVAGKEAVFRLDLGVKGFDYNGR